MPACLLRSLRCTALPVILLLATLAQVMLPFAHAAWGHAHASPPAQVTTLTQALADGDACPLCAFLQAVGQVALPGEVAACPVATVEWTAVPPAPAAAVPAPPDVIGRSSRGPPPV